MRIIDDMISQLPKMPDWQKEVRIDHVYKDVLLGFCKANSIKSLEEVIAKQNGLLTCSTVQLAPCKNVYDDMRAISVWIPQSTCEHRVEFHYSTSNISADTLKSQLFNGDTISIVAELYSITDDLIVFHPLLMGSPWLRTDDSKWSDKIMWWHYEFFENFVEDFDEFAKVRTYNKPQDFTVMQNISEKAFKRCLGLILGDSVNKDWGGETSDHFTSNIHLNGRRVTAAFLLKGPARFAPMSLNHLGKNNDQIVRLAQEPADVLIVQHCHEILPAVRSTLRVFAVQPYGSRRYCLIDGKDSLWLLKAYGLYETAVQWNQ